MTKLPWFVTACTLTATACGISDEASDDHSDAVTAPSYITSFDRTESPISEGGAWSNASGDWAKVRTAGGVAIGTQTGFNNYDDSYAHLSGFPADQSAEAVVQLNPSIDASCSHEVELLLRVNDAPHSFKAYEVLLNFEGGIQFVRLNGPIGNFTVLPGGDRYYGLRTGDVFKATIVGNVITAFINGRQIAQSSDPGRDDSGNPQPPYTTGNPGIGFFKRECGSNADFGFASFTAAAL